MTDVQVLFYGILLPVVIIAMLVLWSEQRDSS